MADPEASLLGRLEKVDLRTVWSKEDIDFTPWLAGTDNLALLGEAIGFQLELASKEEPVGPFRADILCKDVEGGHWVLIENQLERTDHTHLGQLLTYAAGLNAVSIVWVAQRFTDEHRAALDWLNEITDERFNFFGLEIELWRIGESPVAPKFNVVSKPNDWVRAVAAGASRAEPKALTEAKLLQRRFWTGFREYALQNSSTIKPTKPLPQHWMNIAIGRAGCQLTAIASMYDSVARSYGSHEVRAEFEVHHESAEDAFNVLESQKEEIEAELGEPLIWYNPEDARVCRIYFRKTTHLNDEDAWPLEHQWLLQKLEALREVFGPRIKRL